MAPGKHRRIHPPAESLIAAVVVVVVVSLAVGALLSATSEPTLPDPVDSPLLVAAPAGLDPYMIQTA